MNDIVRRDPRAEWIARNRLHPLHGHALRQGGEVRWMGPTAWSARTRTPSASSAPTASAASIAPAASRAAARRASAVQEAQLPLHVVEQPAFLVAVVPDMVGGRLSSHDKDLLGLARKLAGNDGAVLAVVFGEHKESAFDSAGVDRLLHLAGGEYDGYAPEQRILAPAQPGEPARPAPLAVPGQSQRRWRTGPAPGRRTRRTAGRTRLAGRGRPLHRPRRPAARTSSAPCRACCWPRRNAPSRSAKPAMRLANCTWPRRWRATCHASRTSARWPWTRRGSPWPRPSSFSPAATACRTGAVPPGRRRPRRHRGRLAGGGGRRAHAAQPSGRRHRYLGPARVCLAVGISGRSSTCRASAPATRWWR